MGERGLLNQVEELIGEDLMQVEAIFQEELQSRQPCVRDIFTHVSRFRGKRLRPILLLLSAQATGGINQNHRVLSAVVEMIHTATLVHDDVLDEAETRRHVATVNTRWNNETSVLYGDYLFTHAFHLAASLESTRACRMIGRATNVVCEGELSQISERGNVNLDEARYLEIIDGKTAELCAICCELGAIYSEASPEGIKALEQYGRSLGLAFQIADDLLDLLGSEKVTGKSLGTDLQKPKLTLPLIRLLSTANAADGAHLRELLSHPDEKTASALLPYLEKSDALEYTRQRAAEYATDARTQLSILPPTPAKRILEAITDFVTERSF
ncbi:MAG: polyprenyl synthetase family protein [Planctomycetaceae bacterium]|nr:polyprenyl synthetase family protein [Planctomycetaceae bacterium]